MLSCILDEHAGAVFQPSVVSQTVVVLPLATTAMVADWGDPGLAFTALDATADPPLEDTAAVLTSAGPDALESATALPPLEAACAVALA